MRTYLLTLLVMMCGFCFACEGSNDEPASTRTSAPRMIEPDANGKVLKSEAEWKKLLTTEQFYILREKGTERAYSNAYFKNHDKGDYLFAACGQQLFSSDAKFDSGTGWPSFWKPVSENAVIVSKDADGSRDEVTCSRCDGHLGHVFDDGPKPTGLRYCMNSGAMVHLKK